VNVSKEFEQLLILIGYIQLQAILLHTISVNGWIIVAVVVVMVIVGLLDVFLEVMVILVIFVFMLVLVPYMLLS